MSERHAGLNSAKDALEDIGAAGEAARLQLHLLSMQARQRTADLEASLDAEGRPLGVVSLAHIARNARILRLRATDRASAACTRGASWAGVPLEPMTMRSPLHAKQDRRFRP